MKDKIRQSVEESIKAVAQLREPHALAFIEKAASLLAETFIQGNKAIIAGNGGSLCDASHFAEELTGFFRRHRRALPAIALSDPGHITCTGNDVGFEWIFSRGIEAYGRPGDLFIGLTTSGNSPNMVRAFETAKALELRTIAFLGKGGGKIKHVADLELIINGFSTSDRIQEAHMAAIHILIEMMEHQMFSQMAAPLSTAC
ncbi:MAG: SIS domain-containing protein [Parachlamydia sp.]|nr:SIS domain-containing protein [Parachlamydia sp.]